MRPEPDEALDLGCRDTVKQGVAHSPFTVSRDGNVYDEMVNPYQIEFCRLLNMIKLSLLRPFVRNLGSALRSCEAANDGAGLAILQRGLRPHLLFSCDSNVLRFGTFPAA